MPTKTMSRKILAQYNKSGFNKRFANAIPHTHFQYATINLLLLAQVSGQHQFFVRVVISINLIAAAIVCPVTSEVEINIRQVQHAAFVLC